jgi:hypothetical protein
MRTETVCARQSWTAASLDSPESWYYRLPPGCLNLLEEQVQRLRREPRTTTELFFSAPDRDACERYLADACQALEHGRGFAILEGLPSGRYSDQELQAIYWLLGQALGDPFEQNVQGTLLYDVRDTGQDVRYGARFSVTSAESTFHTDNSFGAQVLDYVGLLCLQPAKAGGLSQLVSGHSVSEELRRRNPAAWEALQQPFHFDRRGGVRPGEALTVQFPVLERKGDELLWRYLRYWIETGHEKAGEPLTAEQVRALDALDGVLAEPGLRAEFSLRAGSMLFCNNRWILHNRTAFEDNPERPRHYVRLWLRRRQLK